MSLTALQTYLAPLEQYFAKEGVSEISINKPEEIWIEVGGDMERFEVPELDLNHLKSLGRLIAQSTEQTISEEKPLLSATLPAGYRVQVVFPPACPSGTVAMSIRKQTVLDLDLTAYEKMGAFEHTQIGQEEDNAEDNELCQLLAEKKVRAFIEKAVQFKKNCMGLRGPPSHLKICR